jgi:hypothetical protein
LTAAVVSVMVDRTKQALGPGPTAPAKFSQTLRPEWSWTLWGSHFIANCMCMHVNARVCMCVFVCVHPP